MHGGEKKLSRIMDMLRSPSWAAQKKAYSSHAFNEVIPDLFLGGIDSLFDEPLMNHIGAVLSIVHPMRIPAEAIRKQIGKNKDHLYIAEHDAETSNLSRHFDRTYKFIDWHLERGIPVLVHCAAGISRSTTVMAYYLMRKYGLSAYEALLVIKKRRPRIRPNDGFLSQLIHAEHNLTK